MDRMGWHVGKEDDRAEEKKRKCLATRKKNIFEPCFVFIFCFGQAPNISIQNDYENQQL